MRVMLEPVYVLHRRPWRDSSLILEVLSLSHGRCALIARGARRPKSRLHGILQPFGPLFASWTMRGELGALVSAEGRGGLCLQGRALISGFYLNELLIKLLARHDPHPRLFAAYEQTLDELAACTGEGSERREQRALRLFEKVLLDEIGYGLVLDREAESGEPIADEAEYDYHPERGPVTAWGRETAGRGLRLRGRSLIALERGELDDADVLREARGLMRLALGVCLGNRPLHSRELLRSVVAVTADET
ncbi:MAG: DNA repair protein RecO [Chromatiales bacterium]|jgi:DNA repair protein RecO (recombination protein O)|nr:DNA repair protein RecO [Chromatiales bacterium]